jgi:hypothetical protein
LHHQSKNHGHNQVRSNNNKQPFGKLRKDLVNRGGQEDDYDKMNREEVKEIFPFYESRFKHQISFPAP